MSPRSLFALALLPLLSLTGCGGSGSGGGGTTTTTSSNGLAPGGATSMFVENNYSTSAAASILQFSAGSTGVVTPKSTITLPSTFVLVSMAADATSLYAAGFDTTSNLYEMFVYSGGATSPTRPVTLQGLCNGLAVTSTSFYCNSASTGIVQYPLTGTATPIRTITGSATGLNNSSNSAFAVDSAGNIYVGTPVSSGNTRLAVFSPAAAGNMAPTRTLAIPTYVFGIGVDSSQNVYVAETPASGTGYGIGSIVKYDSSLNPVKTITPATTAAVQLTGTPQVDGVGNLYTITTRVENGLYVRYLQAFAPTASGTAAANTEASSTAFTIPGQLVAIR